jgi:hypothetical protein
MDLPVYGLHQLKGERKGSWSIIVNGNWRLTFEFVEGDEYILLIMRIITNVYSIQSTSSRGIYKRNVY